MSRCELSGKGPVVKNLVSHSNIKTKSTAFSNIQKKRLFSRSLNKMVSLNVATSVIRSLDHMGGFDKYILNQKQDKLSKRAMAVRRQIERKLRKSTGVKNEAKN